MRIYVASSWRNAYQQSVVRTLREAGHAVYDFRHPTPEDTSFHWSEIDPAWEDWPPGQYIRALQHPIAQTGFARDFAAMQWADAFVLVLPCGRSAHLEAGWALGAGKPTVIYIPEPVEPELMYLTGGGRFALTEPQIVAELAAVMNAEAGDAGRERRTGR